MSDYETPLSRDVVGVAVSLRAEAEPPQYHELIGEDLPIDQLAELWLSLQEYQRAAKQALDAIAKELGAQLEDRDGGIEVDAVWVSYKPRKSSRVTDIDGFWEFMLNPENIGYLPKAFNPNNIRKTGIPESVLDTFYEVKETPTPVLSDVPVYVLNRNKARKEANDNS